MHFCLAVPTFWTHPGGQGEEEVIYDHPTPLDADGTLRRFLASTQVFAASEAQLVVVAAATAATLQQAVEQRVNDLLTGLSLSRSPLLFSYSHLEKLQMFCRQHGQADLVGLLSLSGYAAIRNLTLVLANLLAADVMVSLDDDEIIVEPNFLTRIAEDFSTLAKDYEMFGLAGLYETPQGEVLAAEPTGDWVSYWPKIRWLNEAFVELTAGGPDLKLTAVALGGNMAVSAALYRFLPFDPGVARGEDIDYVINARMFQVPFFLDPALRVVHDPPVKPHPLWQRLRQDLQRFWYTRKKLLAQETSRSMTLVTPGELMPYPGNFLTEDLEIRAYRAHSALALAYLASGQAAEAYQTLLNLSVFQDPTEANSIFRAYLDLVVHWRRLQAWLGQPEVRKAARLALWG
jgi:hypothetical protein